MLCRAQNRTTVERKSDREPHSRLVWTNDESDDGALTTVTFEEQDGKTLLVMHELYPSKEALDGAIVGMEGGMRETFGQLDDLLARIEALVDNVERKRGT
jgi:uncharacterized protein YndB with AHSA1/START domain